MWEGRALRKGEQASSSLSCILSFCVAFGHSCKCRALSSKALQRQYRFKLVLDLLEISRTLYISALPQSEKDLILQVMSNHGMTDDELAEAFRGFLTRCLTTSAR